MRFDVVKASYSAHRGIEVFVGESRASEELLSLVEVYASGLSAEVGGGPLIVRCPELERTIVAWIRSEDTRRAGAYSLVGLLGPLDARLDRWPFCWDALQWGEVDKVKVILEQEDWPEPTELPSLMPGWVEYLTAAHRLFATEPGVRFRVPVTTAEQNGLLAWTSLLGPIAAEHLSVGPAKSSPTAVNPPLRYEGSTGRTMPFLVSPPSPFLLGVAALFRKDAREADQWMNWLRARPGREREDVLNGDLLDAEPLRNGRPPITPAAELSPVADSAAQVPGLESTPTSAIPSGHAARADVPLHTHPELLQHLDSIEKTLGCALDALTAQEKRVRRWTIWNAAAFAVLTAILVWQLWLVASLRGVTTSRTAPTAAASVVQAPVPRPEIAPPAPPAARKQDPAGALVARPIACRTKFDDQASLAGLASVVVASIGSEPKRVLTDNAHAFLQSLAAGTGGVGSSTGKDPAATALRKRLAGLGLQLLLRQAGCLSVAERLDGEPGPRTTKARDACPVPIPTSEDEILAALCTRLAGR